LADSTVNNDDWIDEYAGTWTERCTISRRLLTRQDHPVRIQDEEDEDEEDKDEEDKDEEDKDEEYRDEEDEEDIAIVESRNQAQQHNAVMAIMRTVP